MFRNSKYRKRLAGAQARDDHPFLRQKFPHPQQAAWETVWIPQPALLGDEEDMNEIASAVRKIQTCAKEIAAQMQCTDVPEHYHEGPMQLKIAGTQWLNHGSVDDTVPAYLSRSYAEQKRQRREDVHYLEVSTAEYFDLIDPRSSALVKVVEHDFAYAELTPWVIFGLALNDYLFRFSA